ncbi:MAG: glutaredoxin family protein [Thiotrichaceae bacterium]|nr:glutaredoxin family protein [Thiotrichaceae bacterium]
MENSVSVLTFYLREGCHLCDQAERQLILLQKELNFSINFIDIDEQTEFLKKYNADVPVLMLDSKVLFRHFYDENNIRQALTHG